MDQFELQELQNATCATSYAWSFCKETAAVMGTSGSIMAAIPQNNLQNALAQWLATLSEWFASQSHPSLGPLDWSSLSSATSYCSWGRMGDGWYDKMMNILNQMNQIIHTKWIQVAYSWHGLSTGKQQDMGTRWINKKEAQFRLATACSNMNP